MSNEIPPEQRLQRIGELTNMLRHECLDWGECDDALERAGVVMHDGYSRKTHVEAVEELGRELVLARRRIEELAEALREVDGGTVCDKSHNYCMTCGEKVPCTRDFVRHILAGGNLDNWNPLAER